MPKPPCPSGTYLVQRKAQKCRKAWRGEMQAPGSSCAVAEGTWRSWPLPCPSGHTLRHRHIDITTRDTLISCFYPYRRQPESRARVSRQISSVNNIQEKPRSGVNTRCSTYILWGDLVHTGLFRDWYLCKHAPLRRSRSDRGREAFAEPRLPRARTRVLIIRGCLRLQHLVPHTCTSSSRQRGPPDRPTRILYESSYRHDFYLNGNR